MCGRDGRRRCDGSLTSLIDVLLGNLRIFARYYKKPYLIGWKLPDPPA